MYFVIVQSTHLTMTSTDRFSMYAHPRSRGLPKVIGRRHYVSGGNPATKSTSRIPVILAACAIAGVASYTASALSSSSSTATPQPQTSPKAEEDPATPLQIKSHTQHIKNSRQAGYIDDHPKPVDDRHGDSVKHHSIAAEKNEHKVRTGIFSKVEFDNDVEKHSADPCNDFEKIDVEGKK